MEEKARKLRDEVEKLCVKYHYHKMNCVMDTAKELAVQIQEYCSLFLQGNVFGMDEEEYQDLQSYVVQVLEDYMEAFKHRDDLWMLDTLDIGLRELLMLFIEEDGTGEQDYGQ